jgi:ubiquinone/menaquinone biosynthesis C-methylase UbiE
MVTKLIIRRIKEFADKFLGIKTDKFYWRFRHIFDRTWGDDYLSEKSLNLSYRRFLIKKISEYFPFRTVLEIGCASGANLYLLAKNFPETNFYGIDISRKAINVGKKYFQKNNIKNIFLESREVENLKNFQDKSIDIIFSANVLIYVTPDEIGSTIREIFRVAKKAILLCELHIDSSSSCHIGHWAHNYKMLFGSLISDNQIKITRVPESFFGKDRKNSNSIIEILL